MHTKTIKQLLQGLKNKDFSAVELTQHFLKRIKQFDTELNSFITVCDELALKQAEEADHALAKGNATALTGIPIAQKDIFCTYGVKTSCGSKMLDNFIAPYDATIMQKFNQAGAVLIGKTNMDEFAMGSSNENSYYGPVANPWNLETIPGGSSGGSAAIVAARLAPATTGTDTGGSIRQPAALCGLTGLKPTYGRVSRYGMIAFASSLDQAGPMTQTAEDAAILLNVMAGHDSKDSTSASEPVPDFTAALNNSLKGIKIGLPKQYFSTELDSNMAAQLNKAKEVLQSLGAQFIEIDLPHTDLAVSAYYVIAPAEASANLSRYDGVRYGYRCQNPVDLEDLYVRSRSEGFGDEVKRRIMVGTYMLSAGFYDAYYLQAQKIRRLIKDDFMAAFNDVDVIFAPTTPNTAFKRDSIKDPVQMYLNDVYTIAANLAGLPAMSIPAGFVDQLPIGLQLIGKHFDESRLLNVAHQYQQQTDWHKRIPDQYK